VYIPFINWALLAGSITAVLVFQRSWRMEEAYGLAIVIDMMMTSLLLLHFIHMRNHSLRRAIVLGSIFGFVELAFFIASVHKIPNGGWYTILNSVVIFGIVFVFFKARQLRDKHSNFVPIKDYIPVLKDMMKDETIEREATNLVYLTSSDDPEKIDSNIIFSIFKKRPRRADIYWFVHVEISNNPYVKKYTVEPLLAGKVFYVNIKFGYKVQHKVNLMFKKIVEKMQANGEVDEMSHYPSLRKYNVPADFKFIILHTRASVDDEFSPFEQFVIRAYRMLKKVSITPAQDFGLDIANVETEVVPIYVGKQKKMELKREM
jgi:KUP system potassium uptake protein